MLTDPEVEAVSSGFGEGRDAEVGVLETGGGSEGEVADLPIVTASKQGAKLPGVLAGTGGAFDGAELNFAAGLVVRKSTPDRPVGIESAVHGVVGRVGPKADAVHAGIGSVAIAGVSALVTDEGARDKGFTPLVIGSGQESAGFKAVVGQAHGGSCFGKNSVALDPCRPAWVDRGLHGDFAFEALGVLDLLASFIMREGFHGHAGGTEPAPTQSHGAELLLHELTLGLGEIDADVGHALMEGGHDLIEGGGILFGSQEVEGGGNDILVIANLRNETVKRLGDIELVLIGGHPGVGVGGEKKEANVALIDKATTEGSRDLDGVKIAHDASRFQESKLLPVGRLESSEWEELQRAGQRSGAGNNQPIEVGKTGGFNLERAGAALGEIAINGERARGVAGIDGAVVKDIAIDDAGAAEESILQNGQAVGGIHLPINIKATLGNQSGAIDAQVAAQVEVARAGFVKPVGGEDPATDQS